MAETSRAPGAYRNAILNRVPPDILNRLAPLPVELEVNAVLYEPNHEIEYAYFPDGCVVSVVALMKNGSSIEVGTIGREGMAGSTLLLETQTVPYRYFIQVAGHGHRVRASTLMAAVEVSKELRQTILRFEAAFRTQTMQGMACNGLHDPRHAESIPQRVQLCPSLRYLVRSSLTSAR